MKKRTVVICLSRVNGGMELASVKLARLLSEDVEVEFIGRSGSFILERPEHFQGYNIRVHEVAFRSNLSVKLIRSIRKILIEREIKNIIFLGASEMKSLYFATLGLDVNFIIRQGSKKTTPKKDFFHKLFYSNVNHFVGNCEFMKQNILDILPIPTKANVSRIYASLQLPTEVEYKKYNGHVSIVSVGRVHPGKGQIDVIKACSILHENSIAFDVKFLGDIQDKEYFQQMNKFMESLPYKDSIEFVGYTANIKKYLQESDVFILPSLGEGMSNAIIEALGYGLIPIIYNDTSSPEFVSLGFHLYLTDANTVASLKKDLLYVAQNLEAQKQKAQHNHQRALDVFSPAREKEEYIQLLV
jgi:glycosyltransferase involved in cell wall biosynthesis